MIRLTNENSVPRVEEAVDRHMRLCAQTNGAKKYEDLIKPLFTDFQTKWGLYRAARRSVSAALDSIKLKNSVLDDILRDVHGRVKEYDRKYPGNKLLPLIFPDGLTPVVSMSYKEEPQAAEAISKKIASQGQDHELFPLKARIEAGIAECMQSFDQQLLARKAEEDASTELVLARLKLVRQYNDNYFLAAGDVDKSYAEKLFLDLRTSKKADGEVSDDTKVA